MRVRPRDFEVTAEDPFANDTLGRQEHAKAVCRAIAEMEGPAVVALDGGWGTGKTAFLAMCTAWLQSELKISVVRFNAWSQSHTQMPLVDLVSALTAESKPAAGPLKKTVAAVGWHVAKFGTRGLVDRDVIAEATLSEDSWDKAEKETTEFKSQLQGWVEASGPKGLVVCVDTPEVYESLTAGKTDGIGAAVKLSKAWPSAPSPGQPCDAGELDYAKRQVEAQLVMMAADPAKRLGVPADFMESYEAAGGDETTGAVVKAEIERWASDPQTRVPSLSVVAESIELFAQ